MKRSKSSTQWLHEHINDPWVKKAQLEGYRARAAYKLLEIDAKDRLLRPGMVVVDLGAAPGSWCQVVAPRVMPGGKVLALDLLPMEPVTGVEFLQGDFTEEAILKDLVVRLEGREVDLVLSDMAPNISGITSSDQSRMSYLAELAFEFARDYLRSNGNMLIKLFQGSGFMELRANMQQTFQTVSVRKPQASRDRSSEVYLLGCKKRSV